ncbi:hypothetical protein [Paracoccus benzoatiresistens]|uniref:DUF2946 domain-containing protein n=1 Tax=Paracoccus benzoatiresistens TaxID=2997341 RepID=A0ABT4J0F8_9RHOB|nr:hypothetical protein [Paracoccus sp. EF6]MCZ0960601.1 hypothetical protein [Paracoccus sp. EF6]
MRFIATFMLMVSLLAMSVTVAGADITRPPCSSQIRADDMCYAAGLPGAGAEAAKKQGICFVCLVPAEGADGPVQPGSEVRAPFGAVVLAGARWTIPWRPPRA